MTGYLTGFLVYMLAMLGVVFIGLIIVKKSLAFGSEKEKYNFLKVESRLSLEPRKNLYIVKAGKERFLISTGVEGCQFMTKIDENNNPTKVEIPDTFRHEANLRESAELQLSSQIKIPSLINLGGIK